MVRNRSGQKWQVLKRGQVREDREVMQQGGGWRGGSDYRGPVETVCEADREMRKGRWRTGVGGG